MHINIFMELQIMQQLKRIHFSIKFGMTSFKLGFFKVVLYQPYCFSYCYNMLMDRCALIKYSFRMPYCKYVLSELYLLLFYSINFLDLQTSQIYNLFSILSNFVDMLIDITINYKNTKKITYRMYNNQLNCCDGISKLSILSKKLPMLLW